MAVLAYTLFGTAHAAMLVWALVLLQCRGASSSLVVVAATLAALVYDNGLIAAGRWIGEGASLEALSRPRFLMHELFTPMLGPAALMIAGCAGAKRTGGAAAVAAAWVLAGALAAHGVLAVCLNLELRPVDYAGTLRYTAVGAGPPLGAISAILVALVAGAAIWRVAGWPWLFLGALSMFLLAGAPGSKVGPLPGQAGEAVLLAAYLVSARRFLNSGT